MQGAHRWWDNALAAAQAAADAPLLACTLTYLSSSAADRGDPTTAWQLANTALGHAGSNSRAKAWMAARAAQEAATMGERYAAQVALDLSLDLGVAFSATDVLADLVEQPWASGFDLACLYAMAAGTYGRLGELRQARDLVAEALKAMQPSQIGPAEGGGEAGGSGGSAGAGAGNEVGVGDVGGGFGGGHGDKDGYGDPRLGDDLVGGGTQAHPAGAAESGGTTGGSAGGAVGAAGAPGESGAAKAAGFGSPSGAAGFGGSAGAIEADGLFEPNDQPDPLDRVGRAVPDQSSAQVKSRALALAEVAYAATRIGELDLAREAGRLAGDLAGRLEVSQAKRRLRALAPLLAETRKGR